MVKSNNKGFSLVEVIIAAAIFAILIYPITTAIISAVRTGTTSTKKQYAVEKAEEVMESFKTVDLSTTFGKTGTGTPTVSIVDTAASSSGTQKYEFGVTSSASQTITLPDSSKTETAYTKTTYECSDISIGTSYETYDCTVEVNDASYQVMKSGYVLESVDSSGKVEFKKGSDGGPLTTAASGTGTVRNLDSKQSAIITGATYTGSGSNVKENNLDNQASQHFLDAKQTLLQKHEVWYDQYMSGGGSEFFARDQFVKNTTVKVTKLGTRYTIQCIVEYTDSTNVSVIKSEYENTTNKLNVYRPTTVYGDGVVYEQSFDDELPPIYLLYVPAIYDGKYVDTDKITVDTSGIDEADEVKLYIFETVADNAITKYDDIITEVFGKDASKLAYSSSRTGGSAADVSTRVDLASGSHTANLGVYANFSVDKDNSGYSNVKDLSEDSSDAVYMYDITVTLTDSKGNKTVVTGTRGK